MGDVAGGIFPIRKTGASTQPVVDAANAFLAALDPQQRAAVGFPVDSEVWRHWSNIHRNLMRHGVCLADMSEKQRELVYALLRTSLGAKAYQTARNAMRLNETLAEMTGLPLEFGELFYWISIFGEPSDARAVGLPDRRSSLQHQLLCAWRPDGAVADAARSRAGDGGGGCL